MEANTEICGVKVQMCYKRIRNSKWLFKKKINTETFVGIIYIRNSPRCQDIRDK